MYTCPWACYKYIKKQMESKGRLVLNFFRTVNMYPIISQSKFCLSGCGSVLHCCPSAGNVKINSIKNSSPLRKWT